MGYDFKKCLSGTLRGIFSGDGRIRTNVYWTLVPYTIPLPFYHLRYTAM